MIVLLSPTVAIKYISFILNSQIKLADKYSMLYKLPSHKTIIYSMERRSLSYNR